MKLLGILPFARELIKKSVTVGDIVVDATAGNGHDTLFLAKIVGPNGRVYSFDIQESAIEATRKKLEEHQLTDIVTLIHDGHENVGKYIPEQISSAIFNLGYLPGGEKEIVTIPETTISALEQLVRLVKSGGIIVLVVYHGHPEGKVEKDALLQYVHQLPQEMYHVLEYKYTNQRNDPP